MLPALAPFVGRRAPGASQHFTRAACVGLLGPLECCEFTRTSEAGRTLRREVSAVARAPQVDHTTNVLKDLILSATQSLWSTGLPWRAP